MKNASRYQSILIPSLICFGPKPGQKPKTGYTEKFFLRKQFS
jgi:hypothetical protein